MNRARALTVGMTVLFCSVAVAESPLFDMKEILDASTLEVETIQDWHVVKGQVATRQKHITIRVGELWPGQDYRIPVRMIVPADDKANGLHLTGGHQPAQLKSDAQIRGVDVELIKGGVGLVYTIVQTPKMSGFPELGAEMDKRFTETLDPHYSIQYWAWPATLMRAVTAAHAETDHFEVGKVALSGGSKNGASPSVSIINDKRMTALHATVSPIADSPLRLCDRAAWDELEAFNKANPGGRPNGFLGGMFGPSYNRAALDAGHSWEDLQQLAARMADHVFISRNLDQLNARGVDMLFHPGTHDMVAYDVPWSTMNYPTIPVYLSPNSGHGKKPNVSRGEQREANKTALLLGHFFEGVEPLLESPSSEHSVKDGRLTVSVKFKPDSGDESGRIWWMFDRAPDGTPQYLSELFPDDQSKDMTRDDKGVWSVLIDLKPGATSVDFFSTYRKTIRYNSVDYPTSISSPYTRASLRGAEK